MALVVEDGTGLAGADAYIDLAFADSYFAALGNEAWPELSSTEKEIAIKKATAYGDLRWGSQLLGKPLVDTQALEFPRLYLYDRYGKKLEGVPTGWARAIAEYALLAAAQTLYPAAASSAKEVKKKRVVVGPITTETEYMGAASQSTYVPYPTADNYARKFTSAGLAGTGRVIRN